LEAKAAAPANGKLYLSEEDGDVHVVKAGARYELLASSR
jgi:hypothetical protein